MTDCIPDVSVVLTTYNRGHLLPRTLDCILGQTLGDFELIISDDCSTDKTREICQTYARNDSRVRYYRNDTNLNMPGNLNAGVRRARGAYIANLHDGDFYRSDLLEKWRSALERHPSAALVFNYYEVLDADGQPTGLFHKEYDCELIPGKTLILDILRKTSSPVWGTVMVRAEAYREEGLFDERFRFISDVDMWMRLAARHDVACVMEPLIGLIPRESDHCMAPMKWPATLWNEDLLCTNIERIFGPADGINGHIWRQFFRTWDRKVVRWLAGDIYHRRWESVRDSADFFSESLSPRLAPLRRAFQAIRRLTALRAG
ncbi:MAG: glycosyltransferase family 2 protein [Desulfomonile tiedjei]|uniref:Glycosyltransferase family 2 protein n=1 Tax=Desulfomonile tiedjei TaxID=2358 RepID=A0A9D6V0S2_9BACT|nr:glycosyltransferase family 2 protein [Desulfomonile tiedjei]